MVMETTKLMEMLLSKIDMIFISSFKLPLDR